MKRKIYRKINETVYTTTLKNGMKVYLLYKPGFVEKDAYIITRFGHFDSIRTINVNGKKTQIPWGSAHFLEHRMFSINDVDAADLFSRLGAQCNAYTTYEKTAYFFQCNEHFYDCLQILLTMMDSFTSTQEQIDNEKKIIIQEANMYKEDPASLLNKVAFEQAYINHPINVEIIGTEQTILDTNKETLEAIFNTFYDPSNLTLVVCGDINPDELESYLNEHLLKSKTPKKIKPLKINEPNEVLIEKGTAHLSTINIPRLALLYKLKTYEDKHKKDIMYFCYYFILDYLFASSGKLSEKWLKNNIITSLVDYSVSSNIDLDNIIFYNIGGNLSLVVDAIKDVFSTKNKFDMTQQDLDELKRSHYGGTIRAYETVGGLCSYFVYDLFTSASDFFTEIDEVKEVTLQDIQEAFENICNAATSVVILRGD